MGINNPGGGGFTDILKWYDPGPLATPGRFDVTGIPQGYSTMRGILLARSDVVAIFDFVYLFFNGDTTVTNYRRGSHQGGATHVSAIANDVISADIPAASSPANSFGVVEFIIPWYSQTSHQKIFTTIVGDRRDTTNMNIWTFANQWENTAAINRITLQPDGYATDEFIANSQLQIWLYK